MSTVGSTVMPCPKCTSVTPPSTVTAATWTVALVGNPNAGKTSVFNALTGQEQHVGN